MSRHNSLEELMSEISWRAKSDKQRAAVLAGIAGIVSLFSGFALSYAAWLMAMFFLGIMVAHIYSRSQVESDVYGLKRLIGDHIALQLRQQEERLLKIDPNAE